MLQTSLLTNSEAEKLLETYSLEEILELNDLTSAEVLCFLVSEFLVTQLEPHPVDTHE